MVGCTYKGLPLHGGETRNVIGCNMSFRRECFERAGFFSSEVGRTGRLQGVGEEAHICLRIKEAMPDARILFEPEAVIYHKVPSWRLSLRYLIGRSYNEGFYKTIVRRLCSNSSSEVLSVENTYLRHLLFSAIPQRLKGFYRPHAVAQLGAIVLGTVATAAGYFWGSLSQ